MSALSEASAEGNSEWLQRREPAVVGDAGEAIRSWRSVHKLSQSTVAALLGMTQQHLSHIEKGKRPVSIEQRRMIVDTLGMPPEELGLSRTFRSAQEASGEVSASQSAWRSQRRWLNRNRSRLAHMAARAYPPEFRVPHTTLIACPEWRLDEPIDVRDIKLELDEGPQRADVTGQEEAAHPVLPLRCADTRFDSYTAAIRHLDPPQLFESRPSYRLLRTSLTDRTLGFGLAAYFDKLDVSEALGHETALAAMELDSNDAVLTGQTPLRDLIGDPFDTRRRAVIPAVTTLTIRLRRYPAEPTFLLHWRDPAKVATAAGVYDVIPAGEFQPSSVAIWDRRNDFDIWRNIVREYSEELLGAPEHDGTRTSAIDYDNWPLFQRLTQAQGDGKATCHVLGLGLDALTLAATILTVTVIDDDTFNQVFDSTVRYNEEGEIVSIGGGRAAEGVPFTQEAVSRMLTTEPMASPGAACLALAWKHRELLGI